MTKTIKLEVSQYNALKAILMVQRQQIESEMNSLVAGDRWENLDTELSIVRNIENKFV